MTTHRRHSVSSVAYGGYMTSVVLHVLSNHGLFVHPSSFHLYRLVIDRLSLCLVHTCRHYSVHKAIIIGNPPPSKKKTSPSPKHKMNQDALPFVFACVLQVLQGLVPPFLCGFLPFHSSTIWLPFWSRPGSQLPFLNGAIPWIWRVCL